MGTPEEVAASPKSVTGKYLVPLLAKKASSKTADAPKVKAGAKVPAGKAKKRPKLAILVCHEDRVSRVHPHSLWQCFVYAR